VDTQGLPHALAVTTAEVTDRNKHVTVQIAKRSQLHTFEPMPKRWGVERSLAWFNKNRRLWKNCERLLNTSLQFIHLAFLATLLRRL